MDFATSAPVPVDLDVTWIHGRRSRRQSPDPAIQVHACDRHSYILRQSKSVTFEAPFLFLLLGQDRALLLDTGAVADRAACDVRAAVDQILDQRQAENGAAGQEYPLVVAHTHGHNDHVAGDSQFAGRPATTVVSRELDAVREFFGFSDWPAQVVPFDLGGGRVLEVTGSPGHHRAAITIYDSWTGFLLTGDTVLPGRLYAPEFPDFLASLERMTAFAAGRPVTQVLGCHIEMTTRPGRDYPVGATYQPHEHPLQLSPDRLVAVRDAARAIAARPGAHYYDDFAIYNGPCQLALLRQLARGLARRVVPARD